MFLNSWVGVCDVGPFAQHESVNEVIQNVM